MKLFSCLHREQYISERKYEITGGFIFPDYNYKDGPFRNYIFRIWKRGLVTVVPFEICNPSLVYSDEFSAYIYSQL
jgi:hypothetical protein